MGKLIPAMHRTAKLPCTTNKVLKVEIYAVTHTNKKSKPALLTVETPTTTKIDFVVVEPSYNAISLNWKISYRKSPEEKAKMQSCLSYFLVEWSSVQKPKVSQVSGGKERARERDIHARTHARTHTQQKKQQRK